MAWQREGQGAKYPLNAQEPPMTCSYPPAIRKVSVGFKKRRRVPSCWHGNDNHLQRGEHSQVHTYLLPVVFRKRNQFPVAAVFPTPIGTGRRVRHPIFGILRFPLPEHTGNSFYDRRITSILPRAQRGALESDSDRIGIRASKRS